MPADDLVIQGTALTVDELKPTAEAIAVSDGRIVAVGLRQVGLKIWVDGSPWIGNIDLSFPYLDTDATRIIGVTPGSCGCANYTREQLAEIVGAYFPKGWRWPVTSRATPASTRSWTSTREHYGAGHATTIGCGSLEVGKYADMVVLSADPRTVPPEEIADLEVRATFLAGRQVYAIQD